MRMKQTPPKAQGDPQQYQGPPGPQDFGVILHQPLNLSIFRKNSVFSEKMNGPPVCLAQKSENAPTWRPRKHFFGPLFLGLKVLVSAAFRMKKKSQIPNTKDSRSLLLLLTSIFNSSQHPLGKPSPPNIQL